jgi:hypothetical protein
MAVRRSRRASWIGSSPGDGVGRRGEGFGVRRQMTRCSICVEDEVGGRQRFLTIGKHGSPWDSRDGTSKQRSLLGAVRGRHRSTAERRSRRRCAGAGPRRPVLASTCGPKRKRTTASSYEHILNASSCPGWQEAGQPCVGGGYLEAPQLDEPTRLIRRTGCCAVTGAMYSWAAKNDHVRRI